MNEIMLEHEQLKSDVQKAKADNAFWTEFLEDVRMKKFIEDMEKQIEDSKERLVPLDTKADVTVGLRAYIKSTRSLLDGFQSRKWKTEIDRAMAKLTKFEEENGLLLQKQKDKKIQTVS